MMMLALSSMHWLRIGIMIAVVTYLAARLFGDGVIEQWLVDAAGMVSADRAQSLQCRYDNEAVLLERCWQRPLFGSSPWGFNTFEGYDSLLGRVCCSRQLVDLRVHYQRTGRTDWGDRQPLGSGGEDVHACGPMAKPY